MIALRNGSKTLQAGGIEILGSGNALEFLRSGEGGELMHVYLNFGQKEIQVGEGEILICSDMDEQRKLKKYGVAVVRVK